MRSHRSVYLNLSFMRKIIKRFFTEPLIQFLILGILLFVVINYVQQRRDRLSREIVVDNERIGLMILNYKSQTGNLPSKQQLDVMIENFIKEEIYYREAMKSGLDQDDEIIRRRLAQKFDFIHTDLTKTATATDNELELFYKKHPELFHKDAIVSFSHIYFSADKTNDSITKQKAITVLKELKHSSLLRSPEKGDRFPLQYDYTEQSILDIQQNFGNKPIVDSLFNAPMNSWIGPVQSGYGWHLLFISKRENASQIPFYSIKEDVKTKYTESVKEELNKKAFKNLSEKYIINRAYLNNK
jgi:peptidyl-prolyl cis-trans isomerase C